MVTKLHTFIRLFVLFCFFFVCFLFVFFVLESYLGRITNKYTITLHDCFNYNFGGGLSLPHFISDCVWVGGGKADKREAIEFLYTCTPTDLIVFKCMDRQTVN